MATTFWGDIGTDPSVQPLFFIDPAFGSNAYFTFLRDSSLVGLVHQATVTADHAAAQRLFNEIQVRFAADASVVPLYYPTLIHLLSARIVGFNVDPYGFYDWSKMALAR